MEVADFCSRLIWLFILNSEMIERACKTSEMFYYFKNVLISPPFEVMKTFALFVVEIFQTNPSTGSGGARLSGRREKPRLWLRWRCLIKTGENSHKVSPSEAEKASLRFGDAETRGESWCLCAGVCSCWTGSTRSPCRRWRRVPSGRRERPGRPSWMGR